MPTTPFFPLPDDLDITSISETEEGLLVRVTSHRSSSHVRCVRHHLRQFIAIIGGNRLTCLALDKASNYCSVYGNSFVVSPLAYGKSSPNAFLSYLNHRRGSLADCA